MDDETLDRTVLICIAWDGAAPFWPQWYRLAAMESDLNDALERAGVGRCTGHGTGGGERNIWLEGPDAEALFDHAYPWVAPFASDDSVAIVDYGCRNAVVALP